MVDRSIKEMLGKIKAARGGDVAISKSSLNNMFMQLRKVRKRKKKKKKRVLYKPRYFSVYAMV